MPWPRLFEWLADRTKMPVFTPGGKSPTGSLNIVSPGTKYTLPQVIDLINESLQDQKFLLVRRARSWVVVSSDKKLPPTLVQRLEKPEDLDSRGQTEVVSLKLRPKVIVGDIKDELKKLQGPSASCWFWIRPTNSSCRTRWKTCSASSNTSRTSKRP
jgi:hypothetical protein